MRIIVFVSIVFTLFTLLGIYLFTRLEQSFPSSLMGSKIILGLYIFLLLSFFLGKILELLSINILSEILIRIGAISAGFFVFGIFSILFFDLLRGIHFIIPFFPKFILLNYEKTKLYLGISSLIIIALMMAFGFFKTLSPKIKSLQISINKPYSKFQDLNIIAVSDIHLGTMVNHKKTIRLVNKINAQNPDIVIIGGDIIDDNIKVVKHYELLAHFKNIKSKYGIYSCLGNHEYISGAHQELDYFKENGILMLKDEVIKIQDLFYIIGRDDIQGKSLNGIPRKTIAELREGLDKNLPIIMLDHQPYKLEEVAESGIDFQFSGHTHHGQFWPLNYITGLIFEEDWGYLKKGNSHFYISSGYGTAVIPIRIGNDSEIVQINMKNIQH